MAEKSTRRAIVVTDNEGKSQPINNKQVVGIIKEQQEKIKDLVKRLEMAGKHAGELNNKIQQQAGIINHIQQQNEH